MFFPETLLIDSRKHDDYKFLENSVDFANGIDDDELWEETEEAARVLGFSDDQRIAMYKTCAGILHWGNGKFKQRPREEQAEVAEAEGKRALAVDRSTKRGPTFLNCLITLFFSLGEGVFLVWRTVFRLYKNVGETSHQSW